MGDIPEVTLLLASFVHHTRCNSSTTPGAFCGQIPREDKDPRVIDKWGTVEHKRGEACAA